MSITNHLSEEKIICDAAMGTPVATAIADAILLSQRTNLPVHLKHNDRIFKIYWYDLIDHIMRQHIKAGGIEL